MFHLHEEAEHVTSLPRRETVVVAVVGANVEGGSFLVSEGAQPLERIDTGGFQRHVFPDDVFDAHQVTDCLNVAFWNPSLGHGLRIPHAGECQRALAPPCLQTSGSFIDTF